MLSIPDMAILGAAALLFFGPEQLPKVMRKAGTVMREIQNTSQSFIREMERAADTPDPHAATAARASGNGTVTAPDEDRSYDATASHDPASYGESPFYDETTAAYGEPGGGYAAPARTAESGGSARASSSLHAAYEPPAPDPEAPPKPVGEKLGEPRPAAAFGEPGSADRPAEQPRVMSDFADAPTQPFDLADAPTAVRPAVRPPSAAAEAAPEPDHSAHL